MQVETVLETPRLRLTNWAPEHIDDIERLHSDPEVTRHFRAAGGAETREDAERRFAHWADLFARNKTGKLRVTDRETGTFLGRAGYGVYEATGEPEIGYAFLREHWGKGYASEAAAALRDWFFEEEVGPQFLGFAAVDNVVSVHVLQKIGMIPTHVAPFDDGILCQFHVLTRDQWVG